MAEDKAQDNQQGSAETKQTKALTAAAAAKLVKRTVFGKDDDGETITKEVPIKADEVFAFAERADGTVVVVTVDGQKFFGTK